MIGKLLHWFYCLDLWKAVFVAVAWTVTFGLLDRRLRQLRWWRWLVSSVLIAFVAVVIYATIGNRSDSDNLAHAFTPFHSYLEAQVTGNIEIYRSNFMNVALFYPAGLLAASLLMRKWPEWCRFILVVTVLAILSAGIEFLQYHFCLGRCEIDDVIHNTAGALLGCLAAMVLPRLLASIKGASEVKKLK